MNDIDKEKMKTITKLRNDWEKKQNEAYDNYQSGGENRYYTTYEKYRNYIEILDLAEDKITQNDNRSNRRMANIESFCQSLKDKTYTKKEVEELIFKTINF